MNIVIMHQTVAIYDAIGNDIEAMYLLLSQKHACWVYADNQLHKGVRYIARQDLYDKLASPSTLLIYHHSVYWDEGEKLLLNARAKVIIRYHNITPEHFFKDYNDHHYQQCAKGRQQTTLLATTLDDIHWLVDSSYNAQDIPMVPGERIAICPPFNKIETWAGRRPDEHILRELVQSPHVNLLFVGRVAPNKGYNFLFEVLRLYCSNYDMDIQLRMVGRFDESIEKYNQELHAAIEANGLKGRASFIGETNDASLMAYYLGSDIFLCASEHEGYCVPLPEAQFFQLPIVARALTAVPGTLGNDQVLLGENPAEYAAAVHVLMRNKPYRHYLRTRGLENYKNNCTTAHISTILGNYLEREFGVAL